MIALILLVGALTSPAPRANGLVGLWASATTSRGGIGHTLEFRSDGTFVEAPTVIIDGYYRVIGDRLIVGERPPRADAATEKSPRFKIDGDLLVQTDLDGSVERKERVGVAEAGKPRIIGVWQYRHYTKAIAFERYTDDGRMLFRLPMSSSSGRYVLKGKELLLLRPKQPDVTMAIEIRGDALSLSSDGRRTDYRRDTAGPWYEREHIAK